MKRKILLAVLLVFGLVLFSGCGKKNQNAQNQLNQEKVIGSFSPSVSPKISSTPTPTNLIQSGSQDLNEKNLITPDPGNGADGRTVKEIDSLVGGVSSDDYSDNSLNSDELLAE